MDTQLYKRLCMSVCPLVYLSVRRHVSLSITRESKDVETRIWMSVRVEGAIPQCCKVTIPCKSVRWSVVPVPCLSRLWLKLRGEQGSGPKGVDDLCFHTYGGFSPPPPPSLPLKSQSQDPNSSLEGRIPVLRPRFQPQGPNPSLKA